RGRERQADHGAGEAIASAVRRGRSPTRVAWWRRSTRSGAARSPVRPTRSGSTGVVRLARHRRDVLLSTASWRGVRHCIFACYSSPMTEAPLTPIEIGLTAAIVTMEGEEPAILVAGDATKGETRAGLPFGPFDPLAHRTFEIGLRAWVEAQTGLAVGYVEQLYTFGDRGRHARPGDTGAHIVSIGYLALTRMPENLAALRATGAGFEPWYRFFPWEDWRQKRPDILDKVILPLL